VGGYASWIPAVGRLASDARARDDVNSIAVNGVFDALGGQERSQNSYARFRTDVMSSRAYGVLLHTLEQSDDSHDPPRCREQNRVKTRSLAALGRIRARIARRRRASAQERGLYGGRRGMGRFALTRSLAWPPYPHETRKPSFLGNALTSGQATGRAASAVEAHEREIKSLSDKTGATRPEVRALFAAEFARLKIGAKVASYLAVLTESNVRGMLRAQRTAGARVAPVRRGGGETHRAGRAARTGESARQQSLTTKSAERWL
jgi:hypothetical protein